MVLSATIQFSLRTWKVLKVMGLASVTIVGEKSVTKPLDVLFFLINVSLGVFISYISIAKRGQLQSSTSNIAHYGNFVCFVASLWVAILSMVCVFIHRHRIFSILVIMSRSEDMVS